MVLLAPLPEGLFLFLKGKRIAAESTQYIEPLLMPEMQQVDENPVFSQFVAIASVDVDHSHIHGFIEGGHAHKAAFWG